MPLDSAFDSDDSQPWSQTGRPLRITVHPAMPPGPPADNPAASQDLESDGYPNDWIEPDGYPSDWIVPASASPARNINNKIVPAKAATVGSVPYGSIESDGYPNDWIEQDGYPADWIAPAQQPVLNGPYRASSTGFLANGPRLSSVASPQWSPQSRAQTGSGNSAASPPAYWAGLSDFQQQSPSRLVVPVSDQTTTMPGWIPLGPGSGWEPWADQFIKGMQGLINHFRSRSGAGAPNGGDGEDCYSRWEREDARCKRFLELDDKGPFRGCMDRASARRNLCVRNGGRPDPKEPPEYGNLDFK